MWSEGITNSYNHYSSIFIDSILPCHIFPHRFRLNNFFHFITDFCIPLYYLYNKYSLFSFPKIYLYLSNCFNHNISKNLLSIFYHIFPNTSIILSSNLPSSFTTLHLPICGGINPKVKFKPLQPTIINTWRNRPNSIPFNNIINSIPNVLIIDRKKPSRTNVLNFQELKSVLSTHNFNVNIVFLENLSFSQQTKLFENIDILIFQHGAACAHLYDVKRLITIIEIPPILSTICKNISSFNNFNYIPYNFYNHFIDLPPSSLDILSDEARHYYKNSTIKIDPQIILKLLSPFYSSSSTQLL